MLKTNYLKTKQTKTIRSLDTVGKNIKTMENKLKRKLEHCEETMKLSNEGAGDHHNLSTPGALKFRLSIVKTTSAHEIDQFEQPSPFHLVLGAHVQMPHRSLLGSTRMTIAPR